MISRNRTAVIFTAFGAIGSAIVIGLMGTGPLPDEAIPMIVFATLSAGLMGWLLAHKLDSPFRGFAILTGAVVMLASQIPFAILTASYFWFQEPVSLSVYGQSIAVLIVGGWTVTGIAQTTTGGAAGWLLHWLGNHDYESQVDSGFDE